MNSVKVIKLPSHCIWHLLNVEKGDLPVQRRTATKTMARWLFSFVSRCSSTVPLIFLYLQARNGCFSVFLSFSFFLFPPWVVFRKEKKTFGPCFRTPLLWMKTTMLRILEPGVGWTQAFSGLLLCFFALVLWLSVSVLRFYSGFCWVYNFLVSVFKGFLVLLLGVFSSVLPQFRVWVLASPPSFFFFFSFVAFSPPCDSSPRPPRSLIFSGFIAREYQPFETASKPLLPETAPEEEGDEQLLKTVPFVRWKWPFSIWSLNFWNRAIKPLSKL